MMLRKRLSFIIVLLVISLFGLLIQAQPAANAERPDAPIYAQRGMYAVGTTMMTIDDLDRPLNLQIWYPALNPDEFEEQITYEVSMGQFFPVLMVEGHALLDAQPDLMGGPYPLIIFSHGTGGWNTQSAWLTEHLASYGFIVIAPSHTLSDIPYYMDGLVDEALLAEFNHNWVLSHCQRPDDLAKVVQFADNLNNEGMLVGMIDAETVGVTGHSFGGYTALTAGGAQLNFDGMQKWCKAEPAEGMVGVLGLTPMCDFFDYEEEMATLAGYNSIPEGLWPAFEVSILVDAMAVMAPGRVPFFGEEGLANIEIPTMVLVGSNDMIDTAEAHARPTFEYISSETKYYVEFENAGHMIFANACNAEMVAMGFYAYCSDQVWDMSRAHDLSNHFMTAFFLNTLKADQASNEALQEESVAFIGIDFQTGQ